MPPGPGLSLYMSVTSACSLMPLSMTSQPSRILCWDSWGGVKWGVERTQGFSWAQVTSLPSTCSVSMGSSLHCELVSWADRPNMEV